MQIILVVSEREDWPLNLPNIDIVSAKTYLTNPAYSTLRRVRLFNLCRSYKYQSVGYYVSLLAEARGHKPQPNVATIQDMKSQTLTRLYSEDLEKLIQTSLSSIKADTFTLSMYFGKNMAERHQRLCRHLCHLFPAPFLRAHFIKNNQEWRLHKITPIPASAVPPNHHTFVAQAAQEYFQHHQRKIHRPEQARYDMAILYNPNDPTSPSNLAAVNKCIKAARTLGIQAEIIDKTHTPHIAEYDALFIRETTSVNHHTFRIARKAQAEGLVVIDDPDSILKCTNKVFLAQRLERHKINTPKTLLVHRENTHEIIPHLGLPCVLKQPDSSSSLGVVKASSPEELHHFVATLLEKSDLIIAQEYLPTTFDWRIGICDGQPLWACKYHMAKNHWQIIQHNTQGNHRYGEVETLPLSHTPQHILHMAVRSAQLMGDSLYGVDIKQTPHKTVVIEVNDNPNIDHGIEDRILKDELYLRIMHTFLKRLETRNTKSIHHEKTRPVAV